MVDGGRIGLQRHAVHGLVEFDITQARETIRRYKSQTGEALSFSAFFLACLGKAIDQNPHLHAYRNWRNQLVLFDEVDVNMLFEVEVAGKKTIRPHILRGVNKKNVQELHQEIRAFQKQHQSSQEAKFIARFVRLPGFVRRFVLWALFKKPQLVKDYYGTVLVTSIGMFGRGSGWGIPVPNHSLQLTLGGIGEKPGVVNDRIEIREYLSVTVSFDHDVIDGAPAARFIQRLGELIEKGDGLEETQLQSHFVAASNSPADQVNPSVDSTHKCNFDSRKKR
jgi:pyruvate/2-oxoglutarate dehydrogenase complex dihydrolipoamide acyltransferase (E2) component